MRDTLLLSTTEDNWSASAILNSHGRSGEGRVVSYRAGPIQDSVVDRVDGAAIHAMVQEDGSSRA